MLGSPCQGPKTGLPPPISTPCPAYRSPRRPPGDWARAHDIKPCRSPRTSHRTSDRPRLRAFRGIDTLTALGLHLELGGDWARFARPAQLSAWLGLIPSLQQSGQSSVQGAITKTGSLYARRLLVESAWHYRRKPYLGPTLSARQEGVPEAVLRGSWRAQRRLHRVFCQLKARGKPANVATVAVARELAGFLWAAAVAD